MVVSQATKSASRFQFSTCSPKANSVSLIRYMSYSLCFMKYSTITSCRLLTERAYPARISRSLVSSSDSSSATGKACVCRTLEEVRARFKPGMVLVVPATNNDMMPYIRDAAALVVEEPGMNSHAAIVGKALLKPTIVGATSATTHIRDGLDIAVDCAHGSVQSLQI